MMEENPQWKPEIYLENELFVGEFMENEGFKADLWQNTNGPDGRFENVEQRRAVKPEKFDSQTEFTCSEHKYITTTLVPVIKEEAEYNHGSLTDLRQKTNGRGGPENDHAVNPEKIDAKFIANQAEFTSREHKCVTTPLLSEIKAEVEYDEIPLPSSSGQRNSVGHLNIPDSTWSLSHSAPYVQQKTEDGEWDPLLHTSLEIKDEEILQSSEFYAMFERRDKEGEECRGIIKSKEFEIESSNACIAPLTGLKADIRKMEDGSVDLLLVNRKIESAVISQAHESKNMCEQIDEENDLRKNTVLNTEFASPYAHVPMTLTNVKEGKIRDGPFKCSLRSTSYASKTRHLEAHTSKTPFNCISCSASFAQKSNLVGHMRTHTGEKPFHCSLCSASFARKSHLIDHMRTHTGEKPFHCSLCSASFARKSHLIDHMRTHTGEKPFHCSLCSASFADRRNFTKHTRTHTGEKPFHCSLCCASFARKSHLIRHMRTHTGEKPFHCSLCSASFAERRNFTKHTRTHTGANDESVENDTDEIEDTSSIATIRRTRMEAHVNLQKQAARMTSRSNAKFPPVDVGVNVLIRIPDLDKAKTDLPNLMGVVLERTEHDLYKVGTKDGILDKLYARSEFTSCSEKFLTTDQVPETKITLRAAATKSSTTSGQGFVRCTCKTSCNSNRCSCKKKNMLCNSKCHNSLSCQNK